MLKSMTAYARAERCTEHYEGSVEIRCYNSKNLDMVLHIARPYLPLEDRIKAAAADRIHRGRVEMRVDIKVLKDEQQAFEIDWTRARAFADALHQLKHELNIAGEITLDMLISAGGILKPAESERDMDPIWSVVQECLEEALASQDRMRQREGETLAADLRQRLETIENHLTQIEQASDGMLEIYRTKLTERIQALTQGQMDIDPDRIAQEAAFLADRSDISEELVRAASHLDQFRRILAGEAPAGRKLNFLLQEFNREFNTMGAKTSRTEVAHRVVELKCELEKIREQVQNIE
jgi:uncharacterized protein (TIGR00255 family)